MDARRVLDFLAHESHIERWRERNGDARLTVLAEDQSWERNSDGTLGVAIG